MPLSENNPLTFEVNMEDDLENMKLPSPELVMFYKNLNERTLWLDCDVDANWLEYERLIIQINRADKGIDPKDRKPIRLMFFSYGGDLHINNSLINTIELSQTPVYGYNMGVSASAGCYIFLACHKRYSLKSAQFLLHKGSGSFGGTYDEVICQVENYTRQIEELADFLLKHTKIPPEMLEEKLGTEWYLSAAEAVQLGICDEIITSMDQIV